MGRVLEDNKREILRKWLQGAANEEEQRQLKQWSKHDPFLAEAMEGYEAVSSDDHIVTIDRLRQQFTRGKKTMRTAAAPARPSPAAAARSGSSSRINLSFLAIAASVLVLLGVGTWVFRQSNETQGALESMAVEQSAGPAKEETSLPEAETKTEDALAANTPDPASATATAPIIEETILVADESSPIAAVENITVPTETTQPTVYNDGNIEAGFEAPAEIAESTVVDFDAEAAPLPRANAPARLGGSSTSPIQNTSTEDVVAEKMEQINNPRPVVGYVFASQSGRPLSGARIAIDNSNESVITDGSGRFEVVVDENIAGLRVSRMGFNEAVVTISQQDTSLSIALNESEQLAEVTTRAKAKGRGKVAASDVRTELPAAPADKSTAAPMGGYKKFERYLKKNLKKPASAKSNDVSGDVVLSFQVNQKGFIEQIKVIQSLGYGCDEEAIRLLQNGPMWKNKTPYNLTPATVRIRFE